MFGARIIRRILPRYHLAEQDRIKIKSVLFFTEICRDSSEGTVTNLRNVQPRNRRSIPRSSKKFVSSPKCPEWLWVSQRLFNGYRQPFTPEIKRPGREYHHSTSFSADVKNAWSYTPAPLYTIMAWCLKHRQTQTD